MNKAFASLFVASMSLAGTGSALAQSAQPAEPGCLLIHVTVGPDNPTKAALAFLVAKSAIEEGRMVRMFLAGDRASLGRLFKPVMAPGAFRADDEAG